ncbi:MAG: YtxH domain-containing protein [Cytophagales bacterium]
MKTGNVVLGILAGFSAGALAGILLAPDKGSNTRRKIVEKGEGLSNDAKEKFDAFLESITDKYETAMNEVENMVSNGKSKYDAVKKETKASTY